MIKSKKLLIHKEISHGFFNRSGGKSNGIYKSLNCGPGSKDVTKKVKFQAYKDGGYLKDDAFTLSASKIYKVKLVPEELSVKLETSYDNGVNVSRNFLRSADMALDFYQSIEKDVYKYCGYLGLSRHNCASIRIP